MRDFVSSAAATSRGDTKGSRTCVSMRTASKDDCTKKVESSSMLLCLSSKKITRQSCNVDARLVRSVEVVRDCLHINAKS